MFLYIVFFFFQAEDGIRDLTVTGVQTCALPISPRSRAGMWSRRARTARWSPPRRARRSCGRARRSEEHTSELQSQSNLVCRLLLEKKKTTAMHNVAAPATALLFVHLALTID